MTNSNMLYFSIGYTEDSKDPTEEHINFALKKALQMPSIVRYHHRVWLPHRDGKHVVDDVWNWMSDYTHTGMCRNTIKNCGHIAIWAMTPEEDNTEKRIDKPYSRELFDKGFFAGQTRLTDHLDIVTWNRAYGAVQNIQAFEYARQLQDLGYDIGFMSCLQRSPESFNEHFGKYFDQTPVWPMIMIYAGTEANAFKHTGTRDRITNDTVKGSLIGPFDWDEVMDPDPINDKKGPFTPLYKWNKGKTELIPLTPEEESKLDFRKRTKQYMDNIKTTDRIL